MNNQHSPGTNIQPPPPPPGVQPVPLQAQAENLPVPTFFQQQSIPPHQTQQQYQQQQQQPFMQSGAPASWNPYQQVPQKKSWSTGKVIALIGGIILALSLCAAAGAFIFNAFIIGNSNDLIAGKDLSANDGSLFIAQTNGEFYWYEDALSSNNYYRGTYELYVGQQAYDYITTELSDYGVTGEELHGLFTRNDDMQLENLCCLVLNNESLILDGEEQLDEVYVTPLYGFYYEETDYLDLANMNTATYWGFTISD